MHVTHGTFSQHVAALHCQGSAQYVVDASTQADRAHRAYVTLLIVPTAQERFLVSKMPSAFWSMTELVLMFYKGVTRTGQTPSLLIC